MKLSIWIIVLFLFSSALSAYIGNKYGRKLGKKKISIFSIRPKHSSTILTMLISMAISLALLGSLFIVNPQLKQALLRSEFLTQSTLPPIVVVRRHPKRNRFQKSQPRLEKPITLPVQTSIKPVRTQHFHQANKKKPRRRWRGAHKKRYTPKVRASLSVTQPQKSPPIKAFTKAKEKITQANLQAWIAKKNDTLFKLSVQGKHSKKSSEAVLAKVLDLAQNYAKKMGAGNTKAHSIQVFENDLTQIKRALQEHNHYELKIQVVKATRQSQTLPLRLTLKPHKKPHFSPHDILEKERLKLTLQGRFQKDINKTIVAAIRLKEGQGNTIKKQMISPVPVLKPAHGNYALLPQTTTPFQKVNLSEITHQGMTISGKLSIPKPPVLR